MRLILAILFLCTKGFSVLITMQWLHIVLTTNARVKRVSSNVCPSANVSIAHCRAQGCALLHSCSHYTRGTHRQNQLDVHAAASNVFEDHVLAVSRRLQLELDGALEDVAEDLLGVANQEIHLPRNHHPLDNAAHKDHVCPPLDEDL